MAVSNPLRVALSAWKRAPLGESRLGGFTVVNDGKLLLLAREYPVSNAHPTVQVFAFPKPGRVAAVVKASTDLKRDLCHPVVTAPGSVGSLHLIDSEGDAFLTYIQSHYRTGGLPRKVATELNGWRVRALRKAVEIARARGQKLVVSSGHHIPNRFFDDDSQFLCDLRRACSQAGAKLERLEGKRGFKAA
ncbi:MAG: hypothetical protein AABW54_02195 [Candidatus Micrarchaeota archaeon]